jgi:hypothetical protein
VQRRRKRSRSPRGAKDRPVSNLQSYSTGADCNVQNSESILERGELTFCNPAPALTCDSALPNMASS